MTKVIGVWSYKGGSFKSGLSLNVASGLIEAGFKVAVLDLDPQGTASDLAADSDLLPDVYPDDAGLKDATLAQWNKTMKGFSDLDYIIVDHPAGMAGTELTGRFDMVLVCMQAARPDYTAALRGIKSLDANTDFYVVVNRYKNTNDQNEFLELTQTKFKDRVFVIPESGAIQKTINRAESVFTSTLRPYGLAKVKSAIQAIVNKIKE
jgi:cellulose biosynthesis protein BcsQ